MVSRERVLHCGSSTAAASRLRERVIDHVACFFNKNRCWSDSSRSSNAFAREVRLPGNCNNTAMQRADESYYTASNLLFSSQEHGNTEHCTEHLDRKKAVSNWLNRQQWTWPRHIRDRQLRYPTTSQQGMLLQECLLCARQQGIYLCHAEFLALSLQFLSCPTEQSCKTLTQTKGKASTGSCAFPFGARCSACA